MYDNCAIYKLCTNCASLVLYPDPPTHILEVCRRVWVQDYELYSEIIVLSYNNMTSNVIDYDNSVTYM